MSDTKSFAEKIRAKMQEQTKEIPAQTEQSPLTPLANSFAELNLELNLDEAINAFNKFQATLNAFNAPTPQTSASLYGWFPKCERCGDYTTPDKYRDGLCKDCYIIKNGEWRRE